MIYMGESVRSKYFKERARNERPDVLAFTQFLTDLGAPYVAIGECYAYRSYQLEALSAVHGDSVRWINVVRHPYCWLTSYAQWRVGNMGMPPGETMAIDHEWTITRHEEFRSLGLRPYERADVEVWATLQGMHILNRMVTDGRPGVRNVQLERLVADREVFCESVDHLTHGRIRFDTPLLDTIYAWVDVPFRPGGRIVRSPEEERASWPAWKIDAFEKLVGRDARCTFEASGYVL